MGHPPHLIMLVSFLITVVITAISLFIMSKLPLGIEIDSPFKALVAGAVLGIFNAIAQLVPGWLTFLPKLLTLGLFSFIVNVILFGLAAWLVEGFRLKWGVWSAILGTVILAILNSILGHVFTLIPGIS
ncbi:MAG: phage holin family protein [Cyanobacteria bacterium P01_H01_bin.130]